MDNADEARACEACIALEDSLVEDELGVAGIWVAGMGSVHKVAYEGAEGTFGRGPCGGGDMSICTEGRNIRSAIGAQDWRGQAEEWIH